MTPRPADAGRPRFDIGDIVRAHRAELEVAYRLTPEQRRVLTDVAQCRTAVLGGHVDECPSCDYKHPAYNSCRNRHCPKCQALAQETWIAKRSEQLLDVGHFHVVFTLPSELRALAKFAPEAIYGALFSAASETLQKLGRETLHAQLGMTMVLHTWTRELRFHPHVHAIVTAGGLAFDGRSWVHSDRRYLFPVVAMGKLLRGKMIAALRRLHASGSFRDFDHFVDPEAFDALLTRIAKKAWNVYAKAPFRKSEHVLQYLGRYTHRVGIANSRIVAVSDAAITFRTKGDGVATVPPVEFLRRFVQHVLPPGFHKIRHFGLYASSAATSRQQAQQLLPKPKVVKKSPVKPETWVEMLLELTGRDVSRCPRCGALLKRTPVLAARAPPPPAKVAA